jgi:hypothetical protein
VCAAGRAVDDDVSAARRGGHRVPNEAGQKKRGQNRAACFLHLRDLVYLHPKAASADAIAFVQSLEAAVIAEKATREKRLAEARERDEQAKRRREADRVKAAAGESEDRARPPGFRPHLWGRIRPLRGPR